MLPSLILLVFTSIISPARIEDAMHAMFTPLAPMIVSLSRRYQDDPRRDLGSTRNLNA